ncbi:uncharacterized protein J4E79_005847 [Alternaria viburni]|uniref:uncharacterized protein n=1 Tax=Alternaria viburni TaxID=566460 RepID=UPI0020C3E35A|nr:uncharacterized protein J4E79_005847 [Alternaria viburni]KAI4660045.1 hypothetical protein J4E79_005847 [Alternaria viburni]
MEQKQPRASRRSVSFNPEAPTFSPTAAETSMSTGIAGPTPPTSPRQKSKMRDVFDEDSPFRPTRDLRPNYQGYEELKFGESSRKPLKQQDMPLDSLQEMLQDHHITVNRERPGAISRRNLTGNSINSPRGLLPGQRLNPDSKAPDVGELSAGLSPPGIKNETTNVDSSARFLQSHRSEGLSEGVLGKLIGRALDKPLTAIDLAHYLKGKDASQDDAAKPPLRRKSYIQDRYPERADEERQSTKVVPAPPGFMGERPRRIFAEERSSINPVVMQAPLQQVPTGPAGFGQPRRFSNLQTPNWPSRRDHVPELSSPGDYRPRPRALTRTKRTDQGPEPSHADIYPDDANFMPRRPSYQAEPTERFQGFMPAPLPERPFHAENTVVWPTPAEMHAQKPNNQQRRSGFPRHVPAFESPAPVVRWSPPEPSSMAHYMQQFGEPSHPFAFTFPAPAPSVTPPFDIFENHHAPTYADIHETDAEMECLLGILPDLFDLDLPEMPSDARPLTPGQNDGTRYGLKYYGIGLGDTWACPAAREDEPFRVRPRDHDGWGGWQWAIDKGWGNE